MAAYVSSFVLRLRGSGVAGGGRGEGGKALKELAGKLPPLTLLWERGYDDAKGRGAGGKTPKRKVGPRCMA